MDRNFIIAMVLMVITLFAWQALFAPKPPPPEDMTPTAETPADGAIPAATPEQVAAKTAPTTTIPPEMPSIEATAVVEPGVEGEATPEPPKVFAPTEEKITSDLVQGIFSNANGGSILTWKLTKYFLSTQDKELDAAQRERVNMSTYKRVRPKIKKMPDIQFKDQPQLVCALNELPGLDGSNLWEVTEEAADHITFRQEAGALSVTKTLRFRTNGSAAADQPYNIDVVMNIANNGGQAAQVQPFCAVYEQVVPDTSSFFYHDYNQLQQLSYVDSSLKAVHIAKAEDKTETEGPTFWTGFADNYFATLVGPDQDSIGVAKARARLHNVTDNIMEARLLAEMIDLAPGESKEVTFKAYLGPKERDYIQAGDNGPKYHFDRSIDFGWFDIIARFLMYGLVWLYKLVGNYGVAIIILTVVIKIFMFPLQHKSFQSMRKMQALQPEVAKLKELYKDNKEKMNQEMMALYRKHGANPAGGCLPMLIQLPIFIAFYRALGYAIELRQTPFFWWLQDLSAQDPYYITPILMGASMLVTQKLTPTTGDPTQAKIMQLMPIIFTFLFLSFPAGLVLYWLTNNILSIIQQVITNRILAKKEAEKAQAAGGK